MLISDSRIDAGNAFDWGRVSAEELSVSPASFDGITAGQCTFILMRKRCFRCWQSC